MSAVPLGLIEDLELERRAVVELEQRAAELWAAGGPYRSHARRAALALRAEAREARAHVARLELALAGDVR
jgi:hypothetical protein